MADPTSPEATKGRRAEKYFVVKFVGQPEDLAAITDEGLCAALAPVECPLRFDTVYAEEAQLEDGRLAAVKPEATQTGG